jgi:hypothetical protein
MFYLRMCPDFSVQDVMPRDPFVIGAIGEAELIRKLAIVGPAECFLD